MKCRLPKFEPDGSAYSSRITVITRAIAARVLLMAFVSFLNEFDANASGRTRTSNQTVMSGTRAPEKPDLSIPVYYPYGWRVARRIG
jgi:hypothetical protein